jgi:uncharacterized membrane protein YuzA (DUF378 family)
MHDWVANPEGWYEGLSDEQVRIAYDLSLRGLERQPAILADLRTRAAAIVAAAGVVATLFAPKAFEPNIAQGVKIAYIVGGFAAVLCFFMCWPIFRSICDDGYDDVEKYVQLRNDGQWPSGNQLKDCKRKWRSTINLSALTQLHRVSAAHRVNAAQSSCVELASFLAIWRGLNWERIEKFNRWFRRAAVSFAVEIICPILGLAFG